MSIKSQHSFESSESSYKKFIARSIYLYLYILAFQKSGLSYWIEAFCVDSRPISKLVTHYRRWSNAWIDQCESSGWYFSTYFTEPRHIFRLNSGNFEFCYPSESQLWFVFGTQCDLWPELRPWKKENDKLFGRFWYRWGHMEQEISSISGNSFNFGIF